MGESFWRSVDVGFGSELEQKESSGLSNLLPSVFGGTTSYVTRCCKCGRESTWSEDYMELSMPIVGNCCTEAELLDIKMTGGSQKPRKAKKMTSSGGRDVDVQQCVDAYLHPESLEGDNQYKCSMCKKKCDATQSMAMVKLPPVLNIQLARYVFDR
jgi:ubiquitin C-terminal hydrolase